MSDVITGIVPSAPRRLFGAGVLYASGGLLIYIALVQPPSAAYALLLVGFGAVSTYGGWRMWQVTGRMIELTEEELRLSDGTVIAKIEDIDKVDRSFFAFKPSNGFLVTLKVKYPSAWAPGLWWRFGKRIGIGGVTPASEGKVMADALSAMIATRDGLFEDLEL
ncbi:MAG: hypothetical protein AAF340_08150 [Pseudomonadota bacterium]